MSNIKVVVVVQQYYDIEYEDYFDESESYILEIPEKQGYLIEDINELFNAVAWLFRPIFNRYSYTSGEEYAFFTQVKKYYKGDAKVAKLIKLVGWKRVEQVALPVIRTMEKSLITVICNLFDWKLVTKLPCVINKIVPVIITEPK